MPALDGMRILDLTQYEAGPSATQALAWMGADVVKVERPGVGDPGRSTGAGKDSAYFLNWNANKRSVAIDLGQAEGRELLLRMIPKFDVMVENFGPGVIEKLRLGYPDVLSVHPGIIFAQVKGFGSFGPYSGYKCFDGIAQAASGSFSITGTEDGTPLPSGTTLGDVGTGMQLALSICAAYIQRSRTGEGQHIEIAMQEAMTYYMRTRIGIGSGWGTEAAPRTGTGRGALLNLFACRPFGPNDYLYVMAVTAGMFADLCRAIDRPDLLTDERFSSAKGRHVNSEALRVIIAEWAAEHTKYEAMKKLGEGGVPASAVLDTADLFNDPHLRERGFIHDVDHGDELGIKPLLGWPPRMSESSVAIVRGPRLGEHTAEVLRSELALAEDELGALRERGVIG